MNMYELTSATDTPVVFYAEGYESARTYLIDRLGLTSLFDAGSIKLGPAEKVRRDWEHWSFWVTGTIDGDPYEEEISYALTDSPASEPENAREGDLILKYEQARDALNCSCCGEYGVVYGQCPYLEAEGPLLYPAFAEARSALVGYRAQVYGASTPIPCGPEDLFQEVH